MFDDLISYIQREPDVPCSDRDGAIILDVIKNDDYNYREKIDFHSTRPSKMLINTINNQLQVIKP